MAEAGKSGTHFTNAVKPISYSSRPFSHTMAQLPAASNWITTSIPGKTFKRHNRRTMQDLIKKLRFKGAGVILNAPHEIETEFKKMGFNTSFDKARKSTHTLVFINNNKEYEHFLKKELKNIESDSLLWFAYPKGSSKIKTDINRDLLRATGEQFGITTVAAASINDVWSALRFRPVNKVGK